MHSHGVSDFNFLASDFCADFVFSKRAASLACGKSDVPGGTCDRRNVYDTTDCCANRLRGLIPTRDTELRVLPETQATM